MSRRSVECRLAGACSEEPRSKPLTTRWRPGQRRRSHPSTGCGFLVRKPQFLVELLAVVGFRSAQVLRDLGHVVPARLALRSIPGATGACVVVGFRARAPPAGP